MPRGFCMRCPGVPTGNHRRAFTRRVGAHSWAYHILSQLYSPISISPSTPKWTRLANKILEPKSRSSFPFPPEAVSQKENSLVRLFLILGIFNKKRKVWAEPRQGFRMQIWHGHAFFPSKHYSPSPCTDLADAPSSASWGSVTPRFQKANPLVLFSHSWHLQ